VAPPRGGSGHRGERERARSRPGQGGGRPRLSARTDLVAADHGRTSAAADVSVRRSDGAIGPALEAPSATDIAEALAAPVTEAVAACEWAALDEPTSCPRPCSAAHARAILGGDAPLEDAVWLSADPRLHYELARGRTA
jgi:hypothetical protein